MTHAPRLLIIGLDCAEPSLVFDQWRDELPTLSRLMNIGSYGTLESCIPAITVPAWSCMMSGRDPGELGIYGFRNRVDRSYQRMSTADGRAVRVPRLWNIASAVGWKVAAIGVPGSYPPQPVNGSLVSCFLTPSTNMPYTYPSELASQIPDWVSGDYLLDVPNFRSEEKGRILRDIYTLCDQHFTLAERLLTQTSPDLLMLVEMGVDRIHHAFWKQMDARHPQYVPNTPWQAAIHDYYRHVDQRINDLLQYCGDETVVLVVSDHGARPLMGGIRINQWLQAEGYLTLKEQSDHHMALDQATIDWRQTRAWGAGGYYGRIFLNVRGREPEGTIALAAYESERDTLADSLRAMKGPDGQPLGNRVFIPQHIYRSVRGVAPDLIVYFGDLAWRAIGTFGNDGVYTTENDTGPDDANHAQYGLFIYYDPQQPGKGRRVDNAQIYDILPTLMQRFRLPGPMGLRGKVLPMA